MSEKGDLISKIIESEWNMFTTVPNIGGRASCQEDPETFRLMRTSNFEHWSEATLQMYLYNLEDAERTGRNLMTEKYARMDNLMPPLNPEVFPLIDKIAAIECKWLEEFLEKFPYINPARPIYSREDTADVISSETYARGELGTYSRVLLELYYKDITKMQLRGLNRVEMIFDTMVKKLGYKSLEHANEVGKRR